MSLTTSALQIGRSALLAYQNALQVVGNNISNAGSPAYTRQSPVLSPSGGVVLAEGFSPGGGVTLTALRRNVDESLENRYRVAIGDQSAALAEQQALGSIESILNELSDSDLSSLLQEFFNAFSNLQNDPHDDTARGLVLTAGDSLARETQRQRSAVLALVDELNQDLQDAAKRANELAGDIADLNVRVVELEGPGKGGANALRDQRDQLLQELAELVQVEVREQPDGSINVYVGNEPLVQGGLSRGLTTTLETVDGYPKVVVRFADNNSPVALRGGRMAGLAAARDTHVLGQVNALDSFTEALITEVNKVHAQGQGLDGLTSAVGANPVLDSSAALNSADAGLALTPQNGSFLITVKDRNTGTSVTTTVTVNLTGSGTDDSLGSLVDQINANVANVAAAVTVDHRLQLTAGTGMEFTFAQDSSNVLAALGLNTFFTGRNAADIGVDSVLTNNLQLIAAGTQNAPGDGSNAARIAALGTDSLSSLGGRSVSGFYNAVASDVAVKGSAALAGVEAADAIKTSLTAQLESVSGVSLDEETISLLRLERSFQGAARYTAVVDGLIQELLLLVQ